MKFLLWFLAILGGLFVLLMFALVGFGVVGAKKGYDLAKGAAAYADDTIAAYADGWDPTALTSRAAPELLAEVAKNPNALNQLSVMLINQAGALVSVTPASCANFNYAATTSSGDVFTAQCAAQGVVEKGTAQFTVTVIYRNEEWRVLGFYVFVSPNQVDENKGSKVVNFFNDEQETRPTLEASFRDQTIALSIAGKRISVGTGRGIQRHVGAGVEILDAAR